MKIHATNEMAMSRVISAKSYWHIGGMGCESQQCIVCEIKKKIVFFLMTKVNETTPRIILFFSYYSLSNFGSVTISLALHIGRNENANN